MTEDGGQMTEAADTAIKLPRSYTDPPASPERPVMAGWVSRKILGNGLNQGPI